MCTNNPQPCKRASLAPYAVPEPDAARPTSSLACTTWSLPLCSRLPYALLPAAGALCRGGLAFVASSKNIPPLVVTPSRHPDHPRQFVNNMIMTMIQMRCGRPCISLLSMLSNHHGIHHQTIRSAHITAQHDQKRQQVAICARAAHMPLLRSMLQDSVAANGAAGSLGTAQGFGDVRSNIDKAKNMRATYEPVRAVTTRTAAVNKGSGRRSRLLAAFGYGGACSRWHASAAVGRAATSACGPSRGSKGPIVRSGSQHQGPVASLVPTWGRALARLATHTHTCKCLCSMYCTRSALRQCCCSGDGSAPPWVPPAAYLHAQCRQVGQG